jgi:rRNA maturation endonuclease Nob1
LARKGLSVWVFSSLTFIALLHLVDAISALVFGNPIEFFQLYPFVAEKLQAITPLTYFWTTAAATSILWGITCVIVFENPVEAFLNKILSDAKAQGAVETQLLESKSEVLDAMYETVEASNGELAEVKDLICNVRTEAKEIQPLRESVEKIKTELSSLRKDLKKIEERAVFQNLCPACGKPLLPDFKLCPYCGENINLLPEKIISVKDYR